MNEIQALLLKVLDRAKSSRVWTVAAGNVVGLTMIEGDWPRAAVVGVVNVAYILSECFMHWLKMRGYVSVPSGTGGSNSDHPA